MNNQILKSLLILILLFTSILSFGQSPEILLKTNAKGEVTAGSIQDLIDNIRAGEQIRVGWNLDFDNDGKADVEHWVDAKFLTVMSGHVFNQIDPIYYQAPNMEKPQIEIWNSKLMWTAIIGSNGVLMSRFIDPDADKATTEVQKKQMKELTQVNEEVVETTWVKID